MIHLDPETMDYVLTASRDWEPASSLTAESMLLRVRTERGTWWWDSAFGSTLHELVRSARPNPEQDVVDAIESALDPMVDAGEISDLEVAAERTARGRVDVAIRCTDSAHRPLTMTLFVQVG